MTIPKGAPELSRLPAHTVVLIEQAAARNADPEKVAADLGVALDVVLDCWHRMDILVGLVDGVELHWTPAVERQRDDDNPAPTVKAAADALVRYGLVSSDDHRVMTRSVEIHRVDKMAPLHYFGKGLRQPARLWLSVDDLSTRPGDAA